MIYEDFKTLLRQEGETRATMGGLVPIPELRLCVPVEPDLFNQYVLRLHTEKHVHLLSHVDGDKLPEPVRQACITHSTGSLLYWIRWL